MNQIVKVRVPGDAAVYDITVGRKCLERAGDYLRMTMPPGTRRVLIITNAKVSKLYGPQLSAGLEGAGFENSSFPIGDGERYKNWTTLKKVIDVCAQVGLERSDAIVALGGGVVGDLAGFAAATYLRGIPLMQIPTTLLAQIDSSVGGKTGINTAAGKNSLGVFHHPAGVLIDPNTLATLPKRELTAGWCEAIKQAAVVDRRLFLRIVRLLENSAGLGAETEDVIAALCAVKAKIVAGDPREELSRTDPRSRRILNFGHTVGHALETVTNYRRFRHGEAVGLGMLVAGEIGKKLGILPADELELLKSAIALAGRLPPTRDLDPADIMELVKRDKKSVSGSLKWILLERVGRAQIVSGAEVGTAVVRSALKIVLDR